MTLEEQLREAQEKLQKCVEQLQQIDKAKNDTTIEAIRCDERIKLLQELIKEQNAPKEPEVKK